MTSCVPLSVRNCISCVPLLVRNCISCVPLLVRNCISCVPLLVRNGISCVPLLVRNCIICVPLSVRNYQLRPTVSKELHQLRPTVSKELYQLRPGLSACCILLVSWVVNRTCITCIEIYRFSKCQTIRRFLHSFIVHYYIYIYMHTYRSVEWYQQCTYAVSCNCLMFKPYWKKQSYVGDDRHIVFLISPISSYCYGLMKTLSPERILMQ